MDNNQTINADDVIALFGMEIISEDGQDNQIEALMERLNTLNRPTIDAEDYDEDADSDGQRYLDWVLVRRKGIELGFSENYYHKTNDYNLWGEGELLLTQAYFYTKSDEQDIEQYQGKLPYNLHFSDTREKARQKLIAFEDSRHSNLSDTWDVEGYRLSIQYRQDGTIDRISCAQLPVPILGASPAKCAKLSDIIDALGVASTEHKFASLWRKSGKFTQQQQKIIKSERNLDLSDSLGVELDFTGSGPDAALCSSVSFYRNRNFDSIGWAGELPFGLDFEDDPITLEQKINKRPLEGSDSIESGYRVWDLPDYTLHVLYSNLDNRLLKIIIYQREFWHSIDL